MELANTLAAGALALSCLASYPAQCPEADPTTDLWLKEIHRAIQVQLKTQIENGETLEEIRRYLQVWSAGWSARVIPSHTETDR